MISEAFTPNDEYENLVNAHMEIAAECIPAKLRPKHRVPWETLAVRKKRDNIKTAKGTQLMPTLRNLRQHKEN